jgi:hypothetical protein
MRKKLALTRGLVGGALLAVAGGAVASAAPVAPASTGVSSNHGSRDRVMTLVARPSDGAFLDDGAAGLSLGDKTIFTNDLYRGGKKVGYDGVVCTVVRVNPQRTINCTISMQLPEGMIAAQLLRVEPLPPPPTPFFIAITGGTGAYEGARGQIHVDPSSPTEHIATVYLQR